MDLHGLRTDGDRKGVEPLSRRVARPDGLTSKDPEQAVQQFVRHSPWDDRVVPRRYRAHPAATFADPDAVFVIGDTTFPKQGRPSVGVQRQYRGGLGQKANCQAAVSVYSVAPKGHYPLALRLYLPESWVADAGRLDRAGVPEECSSGPAVEGPAAGRAGVPADEGGTGAGPRRGAVVAGVPPPRRPGHIGLRVLAPGAGANARRAGAGGRPAGAAKKGDPSGR